VKAAPAQFRKTTLKKHNPATIRRNTGDGYHGCLRIDVRRSADLYGKIEGWAAAAMASSRQPGAAELRACSDTSNERLPDVG
jgi:hypothetical protein